MYPLTGNESVRQAAIKVAITLIRERHESQMRGTSEAVIRELGGLNPSVAEAMHALSCEDRQVTKLGLSYQDLAKELETLLRPRFQSSRRRRPKAS